MVSFGLGQSWQYEIRKLMGVTDYSIPLVVASPFVAAAAFCLFLLIGRGLRGLYRWAAQLLNRLSRPPTPVANRGRCNALRTVQAETGFPSEQAFPGSALALIFCSIIGVAHLGQPMS